MLTVEKMHLLLTRADGSSESATAHGPALAAAALTDLVDAGMVRLEEDVPAGQARVLVVRGGATEHPVLDALLSRLDALSGRTLFSLVAQGRPKAQPPVERHLAERGLLRTSSSLFGTEHRPASAQPRNEIRDRLAAVHHGELEPGQDDVLLLGTLNELNLVRTLVPAAATDESRREVSRAVTRLVGADPYVAAVAAAVSGLSGALSAAALPSAGQAWDEERERAAEAGMAPDEHAGLDAAGRPDRAVPTGSSASWAVQAQRIQRRDATPSAAGQ